MEFNVADRYNIVETYQNYGFYDGLISECRTEDMEETFRRIGKLEMFLYLNGVNLEDDAVIKKITDISKTIMYMLAANRLNVGEGFPMENINEAVARDLNTLFNISVESSRK